MKLKIVYLMTSCKKSGPVDQTLNIIRNLDRDKFEPVLVTIYPERKGLSLLELFKQYVKHYYAPTSKMDIMLGHVSTLKSTLKGINPDIIHSLGVFPDYCISRMYSFKQVITIRNFVYEDYPQKFGRVIGFVMARMHLYAMKKAQKCVACSQSLSDIYNQRLDLKLDYIRNGVDLEKYSAATREEKFKIRRELKIPIDSFVYVYTGQLIERKNVDFLLEAFSEAFKKDDGVFLLVLGGGTMLEELKVKYDNVSNIDIRGNVANVNHYLKACDAYVSASKSEGLPNGVLEAMATGIPVVLSDISQHLEFFGVDPNIGSYFQLGDKTDCVNKLREFVTSDYKKAGEEAYRTAHENFSAKKMSEAYQQLYLKLKK